MRSNYTNTILSDAGWLKANLLLLGHPSLVEEPVPQSQGSLLFLGALLDCLEGPVATMS